MGLLGILRSEPDSQGGPVHDGPAFFSCHAPHALAQSRDVTSTLPNRFDRRAAHYEAHAPVQREMAAWLAEWLPAEIGSPALELGAGTGLFTRRLVGRTARLVATDASPRMVEIGKANVPQADWFVAEASNPPRTEPYRWIFSSSLAQWLPDPLSTFRAWHQESAPGARLLGGWFVLGTLREFFGLCPEAAPFVWRGAREWTDILRQSGWHPVREEQVEVQRFHANSASMLREIHNAGAVAPRRLGIAKLRAALRNFDRGHHTERGVPGTFVFQRVEAVCS